MAIDIVMPLIQSCRHMGVEFQVEDVTRCTVKDTSSLLTPCADTGTAKFAEQSMID